MSNIVGKDGRLFADRQPGPDESRFQVDNTSQAYYNSPYYKLHQNQLQKVPKPVIDPSRLSLSDIVDDAFIQTIAVSKKISFHSVGDSGAAKSSGPATEASVADMMVADVRAGGAGVPSFFFHLGDVIYYFGEDQYYYDQFYEPFRAYDRPIFAIPGNHDGVVHSPSVPTLKAFLANFCAVRTGHSPDAGGLVRNTMSQPGVYFTLDAPMVSIIGLYSNVLEGPGVISSQNHTYPIDDAQLNFLQSELSRLKLSRAAGERAVIVAVHHPPYSVDSTHGGSTGLSNDIEKACQQAGMWPDAILSGHAHLYERFTRHIANQDVPYVVSGTGGFDLTKPQGQMPKAPFSLGDCTLEVDPIVEFGYLTVTIDMSSAPRLLTISFNSPKLGRNLDSVAVDLDRKMIVKNNTRTSKRKSRHSRTRTRKIGS